MSTPIDSHHLLWDGFLRSTEQFPASPAVDVGGHEVTYGQLAELAKRLAATIQATVPIDTVPLTAVFVHRSATAYAAILGALMAGHGYVPLNRTFPVARTRLMLQKSTCCSLIVDAGSQAQLESVLHEVTRGLVIICPDSTDVTALSAQFPAHRFIGRDQLLDANHWRPIDVAPNSIAYLLFTSGTTGEPKGVMVSHANVLHYVRCVSERFRVTNNDRASQTFDLTFDLSAHDMFVTWEAGGCVCCPTQKEAIKPDRYINQARLTIWFSVPSTAAFMRRLGVLRPNMYPVLRVSLFCGEAMPADTARQWALAAPSSIIENLYGPTELTIACTGYRWNNEKSPVECEQGIVPIGHPFEGINTMVVDKYLREVPRDTSGELIISGPQLSLGYWQDEQKTRQAFVRVPGRTCAYYRTGDRVLRRAVDGLLLYLGRLDNQIKVLGHRVELGEVEGVVRQISGVAGVVALGWPLTESGAEAIEVFLETDQCDTKALTSRLKAKLPGYMVPRRLRSLSRFPRNANGKYDRKALQEILEADLAEVENKCAVPLIA